MYLVIYQKNNGDIIERIRNTKPEIEIGKETSMGWLIKDIKYQYKNNYYSYIDYKRLVRNQNKRNHIKINIIKFIRLLTKISGFIILFPLYDYIKKLI